jgi:hypothetical protein
MGQAGKDHNKNHQPKTHSVMIKIVLGGVQGVRWVGDRGQGSIMGLEMLCWFLGGVKKQI